MTGCILYQNVDQTVTLLDIPRSLELAQGRADDGQSRRIMSSAPLERPFPSVEPESARARANQSPSSIQDLILQRHLQLCLDELQSSISSCKWCLPRITSVEESRKRKRLGESLPSNSSAGNPSHAMDDNLPGDHEHASNQSEMSLIKDDQEPFCHFFRNSNPETTILSMDSSSEICIPPMSTYLQGELESTSHIFTSTAPSFDLIILDPPWPNRSARRKKSYSISYTTADIAALLSSIPIKNHLTEDSFVGIWITNKPAFHDLVLSSGGIFDQWDVELSEEWIWLKVTSSGTPISSLAGTWRKPYEVFLLGRKKLSSGSRSPSIKRRVLVAVPDLHSRKPNMKTLFESMLPSKYEALEIFARNLTAGWWAWGNEVLKFQHQDQWTADVSDCQ